MTTKTETEKDLMVVLKALGLVRDETDLKMISLYTSKGRFVQSLPKDEIMLSTFLLGYVAGRKTETMKG